MIQNMLGNHCFTVIASQIDFISDVFMVFQLQQAGFDGFDEAGPETDVITNPACLDAADWRSVYGDHSCEDFAATGAFHSHCSSFHGQTPSIHCPVACEKDLSGIDCHGGKGPKPDYVTPAVAVLLAVPCLTSFVCFLVYFGFEFVDEHFNNDHAAIIVGVVVIGWVCYVLYVLNTGWGEPLDHVPTDGFEIADLVPAGWPSFAIDLIWVFIFTPGWLVIFVHICRSYEDNYVALALMFPLLLVQAVYAMTNPVYVEKMNVSTGSILAPNIGNAIFSGLTPIIALALVICSALEDVPQCYYAAMYLSYEGVSWLPVFSIVWSVYRMVGHGIVQCCKVANEDEDELVTSRAENPLQGGLLGQNKHTEEPYGESSIYNSTWAR